MATDSDHQARIDSEGTRWLDAARAYVAAWRQLNSDGVPTVRQQQTSEAERVTRAGYERAIADFRQHVRGEPHGE